MKVVDSPPVGCEALAGTDLFNHGHLPIAAAYCRRLGSVDRHRPLAENAAGPARPCAEYRTF